MKSGYVHIVLLICFAFLLAGCATEPVPSMEGTGIQLTVRCDSQQMTKAETDSRDGEQAYNENLIQSVDFLFYPGNHPDDNADAVYHVRKVLSQDPMQSGLWEVTFNLVVKKEAIGQIFTEANDFMACVYTLVNFDESFIGDLSETSANELKARRLTTDFASVEENYLQPAFLMDGKTVIVYDADADPNAQGEIQVKRLASKLTVAINVASRVELKHTNSEQDLNEIWTPVLHSMRVYLVNGVKTVLLEGEDPQPEYFSYKNVSRSFLRMNDTPYLTTETVGDKLYYNTWPMYSYPASWTDNTQFDYSDGEPTEPPYFKIEMDWKREPENGYSYDRRKYYYKIFLPFNKLERNNWYGFYLDVSILGSETDEGKAILEPTCYLLDWQNKSLAINKYATISKARYLSLDKASWDINNMGTLTVPFLSSHNVSIVPGTAKARRPYYGQITSTVGERVGDYSTKLHAWIRQEGADSYYLEYENQPEGNEAYEPFEWLTNTSTAIKLNHPLQNDYSQDGFDYSPYTIDFDIVHSDLLEDPTSNTYAQYLRHVTIVQRPAIFIQKLLNRDTQIIKKADPNPYGYPDGEAPWLNKPWGYVYINGGRYIRWDKKDKQVSSDPFFTLTKDSAKKEYQWQTVWYTGGSRDMFDIHVTVLPSNSTFVIGDPREDDVNNLASEEKYPGLYVFTVEGDNSEDRWNNLTVLESVRRGTTEYPETAPGVYQRVGFNEADALYGDEPRRALKWYYPTEKSTRTENMLAPSYRIASKFGGTEYGGTFFGDITKEYAEYRCAAYQEDGFPAGRWRLPTKAEIHFIAQLSAHKVFEPLFSNAAYWSANGAIQVNNGSVSNSTKDRALLRCVYDSWYWDAVDGLEGDPRHDPEVFVWGDKKR